jgi:hypothetical protein
MRTSAAAAAGTREGKMASMFLVGLFVTIAIAVFAFANALLLHAILIGPPQEKEAAPRHKSRVSDAGGAVAA